MYRFIFCFPFVLPSVVSWSTTGSGSQPNSKLLCDYWRSPGSKILHQISINMVSNPWTVIHEQYLQQVGLYLVLVENLDGLRSAFSISLQCNNEHVQDSSFSVSLHFRETFLNPKPPLFCLETLASTVHPNKWFVHFPFVLPDKNNL